MKRTLQKKYRLGAALTLGGALLLFVIFGMSWVLMPLRTEYGATWAQYRREPKHSLDVLYFGSSAVYCDVIPACIWEETGLRSYVMAGPEQTMPVTYACVREACRTQSPQAIVVELNGLFFPAVTHYTKANIGYMPWSVNRLSATLHGAERSEIMGLLLPIFDYHGQIWGKLDNGTLMSSYLEKRDMSADPLAGYTFLTEAVPQYELTERDYKTDTDDYRKALKYLNQIAVFCEKRGIRLVCYVAPSCGRIPAEAYAAMKRDMESITHAAYFDGNAQDFEQYDAEKDWYDFLHTNIYGAVKFSAVMARQLAALNLTVTGEETELWRTRAEMVHTMLESLQ